MKKIYLFLSLLNIFTLLLALDKSFYSPENGFALYSLETKQKILSHNENKKFSYASNVKLITTVVALELLGPNFRFETKFKVNKDTIFIKSFGDPSITLENLYSIANNLKKYFSSSPKIVVVDDYFYENQNCAVVDERKLTNKAFHAEVSSLSLNYNSYHLQVIPNEFGEKPFVWIETPGNYFKLYNKLILTTEKTKIRIKTKDFGNYQKIEVSGGFNLNDTTKNYYFRVKNPTNHFVYTFLNLLGLEGKQEIVKKHLNDSLFSKGYVYTYKSQKLAEIIKKMNYYSSNIIANSLVCFLGKIYFTENGINVVNRHIETKLADRIELNDGSGLGENILTPKFFIKLLLYIYDHPFLFIDFFGSLPVYGRDGTLKKTGGFETKDVLRAKTGSLSNVNSISGILRAKSGDFYFFSFVTNKKWINNDFHVEFIRNRFLNQIWREY